MAPLLGFTLSGGGGDGGDGVLTRFNCGENELNWYPDSTLKNPSDFGGLNL